VANGVKGMNKTAQHALPWRRRTGNGKQAMARSGVARKSVATAAARRQA
jgi:hypothetical protein